MCFSYPTLEYMAQSVGYLLVACWGPAVKSRGRGHGGGCLVGTPTLSYATRSSKGEKLHSSLLRKYNGFICATTHFLYDPMKQNGALYRVLYSPRSRCCEIQFRNWKSDPIERILGVISFIVSPESTGHSLNTRKN